MIGVMFQKIKDIFHQKLPSLSKEWNKSRYFAKKPNSNRWAFLFKDCVKEKMLSLFDPVILDTEHVKIRPLNSVSWQKLADGLLYEDSFHAKSWGIKTPEDIKKMYENSLRGLIDKKGNAFVFLNHDESEVLGMSNFMNVEPSNKMVEIGGTWISKKWQRTYVNSETKYALLEYCFEKLKMNRVEFRIDAENRPSQKAVQRLGFHFDGLMPRRKINANGEIRDYVFYSVTDLTWPEVKKHMLQLAESFKTPKIKDIEKVKSLLDSEEPIAAFEKVQTALKEHPQDADLNYLAACICDGYRTEAEAIPFYLKSLELGLKGTDRRDAFLGLASTYRSLGQYENSKKTFEVGIKEFPLYRPYSVFLALTEFNLNNSAGAIKLLLDQILETTSNQEILSYERALKFYSTRLNEVFE
jgi:RimJ/RimL family protein N-acetyltransferase